MSTEPATSTGASAGVDIPGGQAERPTSIPREGWKQIVKRAWAESKVDHISLVAGGVAYAWFLALFPALIAAVSIYGLVADPAQVERQVADLASGLPESAETLLTTQLRGIASGSGGALSFGLLISVLLALWSASGGVAGLMEAINIAYDEQDNRSFVKKRGLALLLTLGAIVFFAIAIGLVAVLPVLLEQLGLGPVATALVQVGRWVGVVLAVIAALAVLYRVAPDRDAPRLRWVSVGSVVATLVWVIASIGFSLYVDNFGSYSRTYGSLAGVAVLMLWFFVTAFIILLGAEINAEAEHQTLRDSTVGEPEPMGQRGATKADTFPPPA